MKEPLTSETDKEKKRRRRKDGMAPSSPFPIFRRFPPSFLGVKMSPSSLLRSDTDAPKNSLIPPQANLDKGSWAWAAPSSPP